MLSAALLPRVRAEALPLIISQLRTKHSSPNCPNHVRRVIGKRIIVRRTVLSMFVELTVRPIKNGLKATLNSNTLVSYNHGHVSRDHPSVSAGQGRSGPKPGTGL